jgi:hypothetical protein
MNVVRPHPGPLPQERVKHLAAHWRNGTELPIVTKPASREAVAIATMIILFEKPFILLPLPGGEGRGEGERYSKNQPIILNLMLLITNTKNTNED